MTVYRLSIMPQTFLSSIAENAHVKVKNQRVGITINFKNMKTKNLESFKSSKFDLNGSQVIGGAAPSYGPYYQTDHGVRTPGAKADNARTTYGQPDKLPPGIGQDNLTYNF